MLIPSGIFDIYYEVCDDFINNDYIGKSCTLYYPPLKTACANCTVGFFGGVSKNVYKHGGPAPFQGRCPLCGGNGYSEVEQSDTIRFRIYWSRRDWFQNKDWARLANADLTKIDVMVIGFISELHKVERAAEFELATSNNLGGRYRVTGKPVSHGFGKSNYFVAFMERV